jgi:hypothetical protein
VIFRRLQQQRDGLRRDCPNLVSEGCCELGVEREHFESESDLICDSGSRTVASSSKLQIFRSIVVSDTIDVVDSFVGAKVASKDLLHHVAMVKNFFGFLVEGRAHGDSKIAGSCSARHGFFIGKIREHLRAFESSAAVLTAHGAMSSVLSFSLLHDFAAVLTCFIFKRAASDTAASCGAVESFGN